jgi:N-acyl-D-amino-acid deacylase
MPATYDVIIRNGAVIDGTGAPGVRADVGIRGDRIVALGDLADAEAARTIDATDRTVSPGFIDVHAHDDAACLTTPLDFKLMQGVTTDIVGNCGAGIAPYNPAMPLGPLVGNVLGEVPEPTWRTFGEWMDLVAGKGRGANIACLVPHGVVRHAVMGLNNRPPTDAELNQMRDYIDEGMAAGAVGLSTGLIYPPGAFAKTDEVIECAKVSALYDGIYVSHIRNEGDQLMQAVEEALTIGERGGLPVQISHHKAGSPSVWGKVRDTLALFNNRRAAGQDITFDVYPYVAASTVLSAFAAAAEGLDYGLVLIASCDGHPELEGKRLTEAAAILDLPPDQAVSRILRDAPGTTAIFFLMNDDDVRTVISDPWKRPCAR